MAIKVAFIGAGSLGFTRKLMQDILTVPELQDTQFAFQYIRYVTRWGREVGLGALDLWDQASYGSPNG